MIPSQIPARFRPGSIRQSGSWFVSLSVYFFVAGLATVMLMGCFSQNTDPLYRTGPAGSLQSVHAGTTQTLIVGSKGQVLASTDGQNFDNRDSGTDLMLHSIKFLGNTYLATGNSSLILSSPDGIAWTTELQGTPWTDSSAVSLQDIAEDSSGFLVAVGGYQTTNNPPYLGTRGTIYTKPPGGSWTLTRQNLPDLYGLARGTTLFVATGRDGTVLTSPDGLEWEEQQTGTSYRLVTVLHHASQFVVAGSGGTILTSPDGINWKHQPSGTTQTLNSLAWGAGHYVAVGTNGTILVSPDATNWNPVSSGTEQTLTSISFNGTTFYITGTSKTLLQSTQPDTWTPISLP